MLKRAKFTPLRSEVRNNVKQLKEDAQRFEKTLNSIDLFQQLHLTFHDTREVRRAIRNVIKWCDEGLGKDFASRGSKRRRSLQSSKVVESGEGWAPYRPASLGFLVAGVVTTPIGALSSPAAMAAHMRLQNASSMRFVRRDWVSLSSLIPIESLSVMKGGKEGISWPSSWLRQPAATMTLGLNRGSVEIIYYN